MLDIFKKYHTELEAICRRHHVSQLDLFGSAAADSFEKDKSDLDFLVTFEPCTASEHYERYFGLIEDLEALFGLRVDLVEESAIRNPYFIHEVQATRKRLYAA